jgi:hypothetical protein
MLQLENVKIQSFTKGLLMLGEVSKASSFLDFQEIIKVNYLHLTLSQEIQSAKNRVPKH